MQKRLFMLGNLNCPDCAAQLEKAARAWPWDNSPKPPSAGGKYRYVEKY